MKMSSKYIKFGAFAFLLIFWFPLFEMFYVLPRVPPISQGPSGETFQTTGIFKPGGYIRFDFDTGIESIKGYFKAESRITALLSDSLKHMAIDWPSFHVEKNKNWPWGDEVESKGNKKIAFHFYLDIPENKFLLDEEIPLIISVNIIYPRKTTGHKSFSNRRKEIRDKVEIRISNYTKGLPTISKWRGFWLRKNFTYEGVLVFVWILGFIGIIALYYYLIDEKK